MDAALTDKAYAVGDTFTVADAALFCVERWASKYDVSLPPNVADHLRRMKARPSVQIVQQQWGEK